MSHKPLCKSRSHNRMLSFAQSTLPKEQEGLRIFLQYEQKSSRSHESHKIGHSVELQRKPPCTQLWPIPPKKDLPILGATTAFTFGLYGLGQDKSP